MALRLRLRFDGACGLAKNSQGMLQWWFSVSDSMATIADLAAGIVSFFHLQRSCPYGVLLLMEDFALPPLQSIGLLSDKDIITVKPLEFPPHAPLKWGQLPEEDDGNKVLRICAQDEFEKESGGYKSEDEGLAQTASIDEDFPRRPRSLQMKERLKKMLKPVAKVFKRKTANVDKKPKRKKQAEKDETENGEVLSSKKTKKKKRKIEEEEDDSSEDDKHEVQKDEPRNDEPKNNEAQEKTISRSSRRKKAKRAWLRTNKLAQAAEVGRENTTVDIQLPEEQVAKPTVVAPGHIRFEPLDSDENESTPVPMNFGGGLKSKKQGQSWGQQKRSGRQERTWNSTVGEEARTVQEYKTIAEATLDFNSLPLLQGIPEEGDVLAYKLVELSTSGTPEVSSFRVGKVTIYDNNSKVVKLVPVQDYPLERINEESEFPEPYQEDGSLEMDISLLVEAHILQGNTTTSTQNTKTTPSENGLLPEPANKKEEELKVPPTKAERWQIKSMKAAGLSATLDRLRATCLDE
ncbi:coilin-like [Selaginella moellendorffii]|uniref:coilin-like n=1 Tax=Selaginella moellendorffii TaxID=88036 RepID=UPI000D1C3569|nr:coilin-like [Selaginella moellendorffii]|eukprot:XP_024531836.1 coilin-like [Selaginella moellendorffii]